MLKSGQVVVAEFVMALLRYLVPREGLPDPKGSLSQAIPSCAIATANREVAQVTNEAGKRGPYRKYSPQERLEIGRYASDHGTAAAARYFSRKLQQKIRESTVQYIRKEYVRGLARKRAASEDEGDFTSLPHKKRGRPVLLGEELDGEVQTYVKKVREGGGAVSARIVMAAARGILLSCDKSKLEDFGGSVRLTRHWAHSLLKRMKFVQRRAATAKSKHSDANFSELKKTFLDDVVATVTMEDIPAELILNWDQTGIKLVPSSTWTMERQGSQRVEVAGVGDKRQITAILCGSLVGDFLPVQLIYQGKSACCHPRYQFPSGWDITHSPKHWSTEGTMLQYVNNIIVPYVKSVRQQLGDRKPALVIIDNFKGQVTASLTSLLEEHDIHVCLLPPNSTDRLQPMDISVNKPAKDFLRAKFQEWYSNQVMEQLEGQDVDMADIQPIDLRMTVLKEVGAKWLTRMAEYFEENPRIIVNGFIKSGITAALDGHVEESELEETPGESEDSDLEEGGETTDTDLV